MQSQTVKQLLALNKQFYQTFGREFSSTRMRLQPGVLRVLDGLAGNEAILDLGCGNGELRRELARRGQRGQYVGLDFSPVLLKIARNDREDPSAIFLQADLAANGWEEIVRAAFDQPFDLGLAFAVLHHIPSRELRLQILHHVNSLLRAGGRFIHSEWQFTKSEKLRERIQPWESAGIPPEEVEANDALLDWRSGGRGLRYVHLFNEEELQTLAEASGFCVLRSFSSDGRNGLMGLYQIWEAV